MSDDVRPRGFIEADCNLCGWTCWERVGEPVRCRCTDPAASNPRKVLSRTADTMITVPMCASGCGAVVPDGVVNCSSCVN